MLRPALLLALTLLLPPLAHAEDGYICQAEGYWESCVTENAIETCTPQKAEGMGLHPEQETAALNAVSMCSNHATQMMVIGNMGTSNTRTGIKQTCAVTQCKVGDITGWEEADQASSGAQANGGSEGQPAGEIAECAPIIEFTCTLCGDTNSMCQTMKSEPANPQDCTLAWAEISTVAEMLRNDPEMAQAYCSALE